MTTQSLDDAADSSKLNYFKGYINNNSLTHKNSLQYTETCNRNQSTKRVKTSIGIRNYPPAVEFSSITNSVFKQSLSQKYQHNLLTKSSFILQQQPVTTTNHVQVHRELSIIDLQLPVNRSFTVAGANLSQQQILAISKRNNINKINDYYSITNSTDYAQQDNVQTNSNHSATLASKIILTALSKTPPHSHRVSRTVSASNLDYNEIIRNSNNNSTENGEKSDLSVSSSKKQTEFQISFPFRNKSYYKYVQNQQKKRQLNSAKTRKPTINNIIRHETPMTNDYLNSISSETLLIRRLKF